VGLKTVSFRKKVRIMPANIMRFAILADVHLSTPTTQYPGQDFTFTADLLRLAVPKIIAQQPDEVIIVGDLVNMGVAEEYAMAREILQPLQARVRAVPGNHELVKGSLADFRAGIFGGAVNSMVKPEGGPMLVLLNSGIEGLSPWQWHGQLNDDALATLDHAIRHADGSPLLVFVHHPPAGTVRQFPEPMMTLVNSDALMDRLLAHTGTVVLFAGHNHLADVHRLRHITTIGCPSLLAWPHAFLMAELKDGLLSIHTHRLFGHPGRSPHPRTKEPAFVKMCEPTVEAITIRV
jgi:3',5'-cyclic AMP phosphodiesterase CpdA